MGSVFEPARMANGHEETVGPIEELIGCSSQGIVCLNEAGLVMLFNQRAAGLLRSPVADTVGKPFSELLAATDRAAWATEFDRLKSTDQTSLTLRSPLRLHGASAGQKITLEATVTQTITVSERLYTVFLEDVTDVLEAEGRLKQLNEELEQRTEQLRISTERLSVLLAFSDYLQSCLTIEEAATEVVRFGRRTFPEGGALFTRTFQDSGPFVSAGSWASGTSLPGFDADDCWAVRRGTAHFSGRDDAPVCRHLESAGEGFVCLPLSARGSCLGVLTLAAQEHEEEYLLAVADAVRIRLANIQQEISLRQGSLSESDWHLTPKGTFMEALRLEIERARRSRVPISLAWFHVRSEGSVKSLASAMRSHVRSRDWAARLDSETLVVLAPETPPASLEAICREVLGTDEVNAATSVGIAGLGPNTDTAGSLLEAAGFAARRAQPGQAMVAPRQTWPSA